MSESGESKPSKSTPAQEVRGNLHIVAAGGERIVQLVDGRVVVGRAVDCDVVMHDAKISRRHLQLDIDATQIQLTDLESSSGVSVDGIKVNQATLADGNEIAIGDARLRLERFGQAQPIVGSKEYIEVVAGAEEPTIVESLADGEVTISHHAVQQVATDTSQPRLVVFSDHSSTEYPLTNATTVIGRSDSVDITIDDPSASREHARLERQGDRVVLRDLDSKNGTWLRARQITQHSLFNGVNFRIGDTFFVYKAGFSNDAISLQPQAPAESSPRRPVVVLPGIMGSELTDGDELFWPDLDKAIRYPEKLVVGSGHDLALGQIARQIVMVRGFIKLDAYSELVDYLVEGLGYESGVDLLEFPYDWRQDNRDSAEKLKLAIERWRKDVLGPDQQVTILCHSMGALVSRYYLECLGGAANVEKFVALGGAHFGAPFVVRGLLYGPDLLPLGIGRKGLHTALLSMPSAYQLVPPYPAAFAADGSVIDLHEDTSWAQPEYRHLLRSAKEFHQELGNSVSVPTTCIFGYGVKTVTRIEVDERNEEGWQKAKFVFEHAGDNRVAERYGYLQGADIHPVKQHHGSLWNDNDVKMRIRLELLRDAAESGDT